VCLAVYASRSNFLLKESPNPHPTVTSIVAERSRKPQSKEETKLASPKEIRKRKLGIKLFEKSAVDANKDADHH
jgi:hypothetical protein